MRDVFEGLAGRLRGSAGAPAPHDAPRILDITELPLPALTPDALSGPRLASRLSSALQAHHSMTRPEPATLAALHRALERLDGL